MPDTGGVFLRTLNGLVALQPQPYEAEDILQGLLAETPELLSGDGEPTKWLFVGREVGVADAPDAGDRWSLDHLFLDDAGIPTLVEVKRSTDTRIRREVVGQLLDYAAHARHSWSDRVRDIYEKSCREQDVDAAEHLLKRLGPDVEPDDYWGRVESNLAAGRLRLVFVADLIPDELRAIVEFLNEQMTETEVIAVEVRQFRAADTNEQMLVSHLIGRTQAAAELKGGGSRKWRRWTREQWFDELRAQRPPAEVQAIEAIFEWAADRGLVLGFGTGVYNPSAKFGVRGVHGSLLYIYLLEGGAQVSFATLANVPPFESAEQRLRLLEQLNAIPGISLDPEKISHWPDVPMSVLASDGGRRAFLDAMDQVLGQIAQAIVE